MARTAKSDTWAALMGIYLKLIKPIRPYITPQEFLVLMFIFERTCSFKKSRERIPLRHFLLGVRDAEHNVVATRVGLSKTNLLAALRHLENKNIIHGDYEFRGGPCYYEIVPLEEIDFEHVQRYVREHQPKELARGLVVDRPSYHPTTQPRLRQRKAKKGLAKLKARQVRSMV